eukprot:scaffold199702_cov46-Cyclotella_meneghiniana.AAC.1
MATSTAPSPPNNGISDVQGKATHCVANHLADVRLPVRFALFVFLASSFLQFSQLQPSRHTMVTSTTPINCGIVQGMITPIDAKHLTRVRLLFEV